MIFDKLQKYESLPSGQMKQQNTVASCEASWLRYRLGVIVFILWERTGPKAEYLGSS